MSGQGAFGDRHCLGEALRLAARGLVVLALAVVLFVAMACQKPADNVQPRDCADRDNAEVCAP